MNDYTTTPITTSVKQDAFVVFSPDENLPMVQIIQVPCAIISLAACFLTCYTILKHLRNKLYKSVFFYSIAQFILVLFIVGANIIQFKYDIMDVTMCRVLACLNTFTLIIPNYGVLLIAGVKVIYLVYPLRNGHYLKTSYQYASMLGIVVIALTISVFPQVGLCQVNLVQTSANTDTYKHCEYGSPKQDKSCAIFYIIYLGLGYILPVASVITFSAVITRIVLRSRRTHRTLTTSTASSRSQSTTRTHHFLEKMRHSFGSSKDDSSSSIEDTSAEQSRIPWSIISVTIVNIISTLLWLPTEMASSWVHREIADGMGLSWLVDVMYSTLLVSMTLTPIIYVVTSRSLSEAVIKDLRKICGCCKRGCF